MEMKSLAVIKMMYLPHLSFTGTKRGQVESVRIRSDLRGQGLGTRLMEHAVETAKDAGCGIFQLTSNKERVEANKFYRQFGLEPTHDGYKIVLFVVTCSSEALQG